MRETSGGSDSEEEAKERTRPRNAWRRIEACKAESIIARRDDMDSEQICAGRGRTKRGGG